MRVIVIGNLHNVLQKKKKKIPDITEKFHTNLFLFIYFSLGCAFRKERRINRGFSFNKNFPAKQTKRGEEKNCIEFIYNTPIVSGSSHKRPTY